MSNDLLKSLPSIDRLLTTAAAGRLAATMSRDRVRDLFREITDELRRELLASADGDAQALSLDEGRLAREIERRAEARHALLARPSLDRVVNATGVIVHTNLGRAPLARAATCAVAAIASSYSNLEYDLEKGERGKRESHCRELLARLTASQDATVVNNNAAAVLLVLNTLAEGGEVIVSRGELVEIGGSFRIPEVMERSGARLREVGTTNRTRIGDYERAINENTKLIMRVHPSNYRVVGFTERPSASEVADLARRAGLPSFEDLGSGCLIDLAPFGVIDEPVVAESVRAGISLVSFSGDKMLGGPQAGVIAGDGELIERVRRNPLMRALRVDKMTYAALEATLSLYDRGVAHAEIPVIRAISQTRGEIEGRAAQLAKKITEATGGRFKASLEEGGSVVGGGAAPEVKLPTVLIAIEDGELTASSIEASLRASTPPVIARTERNRVLLDLRTVAAEEEEFVIAALAKLAEPAPGARAADGD